MGKFTVDCLGGRLRCGQGRGLQLTTAGTRLAVVDRSLTNRVSLRGGPRSSDHVDLLGNVDVMEDVLRIAAGQQLNDNITSNLDEIASRVTLPDSARDDSWSWNLS